MIVLGTEGQRLTVQKHHVVSDAQSVKPVEQEMYHDSFCVGGKDYGLAIPMSAYQVMRDAVEVADGAAQTTNDVLRMAMLLFLNYVDAAIAMSESFGGGGGTGTGWGKDKDEDELEWARRCAKMANWLCKPIVRRWKRGK